MPWETESEPELSITTAQNHLSSRHYAVLTIHEDGINLKKRVDEPLWWGSKLLWGDFQYRIKQAKQYLRDTYKSIKQED